MESRLTTLKREGVPPKVRSVAFVNATAEHGKYDKTMLLLLGQERAGAAVPAR